MDVDKNRAGLRRHTTKGRTTLLQDASPRRDRRTTIAIVAMKMKARNGMAIIFPSSLASPPPTGSTPGVAVRFTVAVGTGVSLGGFSGGGFGVFIGGGGTGVFVGGEGTGVSVSGGGGVGVKPADAGAGCQATNTKATTPKIRILGKIRCGICVCLLSSRNGRTIVAQEHMGKSRLRIVRTELLQFALVLRAFARLNSAEVYHERKRGCRATWLQVYCRIIAARSGICAVSLPMAFCGIMRALLTFSVLCHNMP
jgi:hypothetical protein